MKEPRANIGGKLTGFEEEGMVDEIGSRCLRLTAEALRLLRYKAATYIAVVSRKYGETPARKMSRLLACEQYRVPL